MPHPLGLSLAGAHVRVKVYHVGQLVERWVSLLLSELDLPFINKPVILGCGGLDCIIRRVVSLYYHLPRRVTSTGPSGHLAEELEGPFTGAKVWEIHPNIRQHYAYKAHIGHVYSFGNHLSAYQYLRLPPEKALH